MALRLVDDLLGVPEGDLHGLAPRLDSVFLLTHGSPPTISTRLHSRPAIAPFVPPTPASPPRPARNTSAFAPPRTLPSAHAPIAASPIDAAPDRACRPSMRSPHRTVHAPAVRSCTHSSPLPQGSREPA